MLHSTQKLLAVLAFTFSAPAAFAASQDWYIVGAAGLGRWNGDNLGLYTPFSLNSDGYSQEGKRLNTFSFSGALGYRISRNVSVEFGHTDYGKAGIDGVRLSGPAGLTWNFPVAARGRGTHGSVVIEWPQTEEFAWQAQFGVVHARITTAPTAPVIFHTMDTVGTIRDQPGPELLFVTHKTQVMYGLGFRQALSEKLSLIARLQQLEEFKLFTMQFGLQYQF